MERWTNGVPFRTPCKRWTRSEYASRRAYLCVVIRYMELRTMGTRERKACKARAEETGASGVFCGKEHLRGWHRRRFGKKG